MRLTSARRSKPTRLLLFAWLLTTPAVATAATLSHERLAVEIDQTSGALTVVDRASGRTWRPDPWQNSAGLLEVARVGSTRWCILSDAAGVRVTKNRTFSRRRRGSRASSHPASCEDRVHGAWEREETP
ncbi:MAG TPA: hypothetical protein VMY37_08635 [Thermoguttaceae bacterium]|nr:hypothetical protein [Thermoguttaceae bacterium]